MKISIYSLALLVASAASVRAQTIEYLDMENRTSPIVLTGDQTVNLMITFGAATQSGAISGEGSIAKIGAGIIFFTNKGSFTGTTSVMEGTLIIDNGTTAGSLQSGPVVSGSGRTTALVSAGGTLVIAESQGSITGGSVLEGEVGGIGGIGVDVNGGVLINYGTITGGSEKAVDEPAEDPPGGTAGGTGVVVRSGGVFTNTGKVTGGAGVRNSADGGVGLMVKEGGSISNSGSVTGGAGSNKERYGGNGGTALVMSTQTDVTLSGTYTGGAGATVNQVSPTTGGLGVDVTLSALGDKSLVNNGTLAGGIGSAGQNYGLKANIAKDVTNNGTISGGLSIGAAETFLNEGTITGATRFNNLGSFVNRSITGSVEIGVGGDFDNSGQIIGTAGMAGVSLAQTVGSTFSNTGSIMGGAGHSGLNGSGVGGIGLNLTSFDDVVISGTIAGGFGGSGVTSNADGGAGVNLLLNRGATIASDTVITGGAGGGSYTGGASGGAGLIVNAQDHVVNYGTIMGGEGGSGLLGGGSAGIGADVSLAADADFTNEGFISTWSGNWALRVNTARSVINEGTISGGALVLHADSFVNEGSITGFDGVGTPTAAADGGTGANLTLTGGVTFSSASVISGGAGSGGFSLVAGNGGAGLILNAQSHVVNAGTITGGNGGTSPMSAGFGGIGAEITLSADADFTNEGSITGGSGNAGLLLHLARDAHFHGLVTGGAGVDSAMAAMNGGAGAILTLSGGATFSDTSIITGGAGSGGFSVYAGHGGAGLILNAQGNVMNAGTITGGDGGTSGIGSGSGGIGAEITLGANATFTNEGSITGGAGSGGFSIYAGDGGAGLILNAQSHVVNAGTITGGNGGTSPVSLGFGGIGAEITLSADADFTNQGTINGGLGNWGLKINTAREVINTGTILGGVLVLHAENFMNESRITGHDGVGTPTTAGHGVTGANLTLTGGATFASTSVITGGAGSGGFSVYGGNGGAGLILNAQGNVVNAGTITGGNGGTAGINSGSGGIGADITLGADASFTNEGGITGGSGNTGLRVNSGRDVYNHGLITGGAGMGSFVTSADGGSGANLTLTGGATFSSTSVITGGDGSSGFAPSGGNGGTGLVLNAQENSVNAGTITGGKGGTGATTNGIGGIGAVVTLGADADFTNDGTISGGEGAWGLRVNRARIVTNNHVITGGLLLQATEQFANAGTVNGNVTVESGAMAFTNSGAITGTVSLADAVNTIVLGMGSRIGGDLNGGANTASTLILDGAGTEIFSNVVAGTLTLAGDLIKQGEGTWTLDTAHNLTGRTLVTSGTLLATNTAGSATGGSAITVSGAGVLAGTGAVSGPLTIRNGGRVEGALGIGGPTTIREGGILQGSVNATGSVTILDGGLLRGTATVSGPLSVQSGGTLSGTPMLGAVTMADGAILSPGEGGAGTINAGSLMLSAATYLNYDLGTLSDLINVSGALTLDGLFNITPGEGFGMGTYRLFNYGGALTDNTLVMGYVPGGYTYNISASGGEVNLVVSYDGLAFWNGGSSTWNSANSSWTNFEGTSSFAWIPGTAVFRDSSVTVTVEGTQFITGLQFNADTTLSEGELEFAGGAEFRVEQSVTGEVNSVISGAGGLVKSGGGELVLTGENTFTGGVNINSGKLWATSDAALGDASNGITFFEGSLRLGEDTSRSIHILSSATFDLYGSVTINGAVTGSGNLITTGDGILTLTQAPSYTGGTVVNSQWLFTSGHSLTTQYLAGSGQLSLQGEGDSGGDLTIMGQSNAEFSGYVYTEGALIMVGGGTQVFSGETRVGSVTLQMGTLRAASALGLSDHVAYTVNGGTLDLGGFNRTFSSLSGNGAGAVIDLGTATLTVDQSVDTTYAGAIVGQSGSFVAGSLVKAGTGRLTLEGQSSFAGSTIVNGGELFVAAGGSLTHSYAGIQFGASAIVEGSWTTRNSFNIGGNGAGTLTIRNGGTVSSAVDGIIGGSFAPGTVSVTGTGSNWTVGSWILIGGMHNGAQGALHIDDGGSVASGAILMASAPYSTATLEVSNGGTLTTGYIQKETPSGPPITASVVIDGGTLRATGDQGDYLRGFAPGDIHIAAGGLTFDTSYETTDEAGDPAVAGAHVTVNAMLSGQGGFTKTGVGTLALTAASDFAGGTTVGGGTLILFDVGGGASVLGTGGLIVESDGTLQGTGAVLGDALVKGTLSPGNSPGQLHFKGDLELTDTAVVSMELASLLSHDLIMVDELLTYNGTLSISLVGEYQANVNDSFDLFDFGPTSPTGAFDQIVFTNAGYAGVMDYETGILLITQVPEPNPILLLALVGALGSIIRYRRQR